MCEYSLGGGGRRTSLMYIKCDKIVVCVKTDQWNRTESTQRPTHIWTLDIWHKQPNKREKNFLFPIYNAETENYPYGNK
jgi:hypothetical protein